jgi:hypothetical protein
MQVQMPQITQNIPCVGEATLTLLPSSNKDPEKPQPKNKFLKNTSKIACQYPNPPKINIIKEI